MTDDDARIKTILASARKIHSDASAIGNASRRHDLIAEAAAIITLCQAAMKEASKTKRKKRRT